MTFKKHESGRTLADLQKLQQMPLQQKIIMTKARIRQWVERYGIDHVYVSFSGGKDSTVLLHMAREMYPDIKAVFFDTFLEFPEVRKFALSFDDVEVVKPKMNFRETIVQYGYPIFSKEISEAVYGARRWLTALREKYDNPSDRQTDRQTDGNQPTNGTVNNAERLFQAQSMHNSCLQSAEQKNTKTALESATLTTAISRKTILRTNERTNDARMVSSG